MKTHSLFSTHWSLRFSGVLQFTTCSTRSWATAKISFTCVKLFKHELMHRRISKGDVRFHQFSMSPAVPIPRMPGSLEDHTAARYSLLRACASTLRNSSQTDTEFGLAFAETRAPAPLLNLPVTRSSHRNTGNPASSSTLAWGLD